MRRHARNVCPVLALLLLAAPAAASTQAPPAPRPAGAARSPKVLIVGIGGLVPGRMGAARTPALEALRADGAFSARARGARPTLAGPGWASVLTGVWPEKHGVRSDDLTGNRLQRHPDLLTLVERSRPELRTLAVVGGAPRA
ncbi:MAG: nucleotide pyrophosphatase, partial [Gemmatimonadetes bacterium]|nr:nucleotide pyrophosphatase [Gemmatimonadota bacterium]